MIYEQRMLLLVKRIFTHPSIFTFCNVTNFSETKIQKLSKLTQVVIKNVSRIKKNVVILLDAS